MKHIIKIFTLFTAFLLSVFSVLAQESENGEFKRQSFQVSFIPFLGTNGINSPDYINELSINIIAGYSGGVDGVEIGGMLNIDRDFVSGLQIAGFGNIVGGSVEGIQVSGFANACNGNLNGAQIAGFSNVIRDYVDGIQIAGFANVNGNKMKALQIAGFCNVVKDRVDGIQLAGFANVNGNDARALQIAGFTNLVRNDFTGTQVSGFLNIARNVKGVQIGFINICDSIEGIPIGFLSIAKNGYKAWEIWGNESLNAGASFKIGVKKFYNIFSLGVHPFGPNFLWGYGYGIGSEIMLNQNTRLNIEGITYQINDRTWEINNLNMLNQIRFNFGKNISDNVNFFIGPTYNIYISKDSPSNDIFGLDIPPFAFYDKTRRNTNVKMWFGVNAGFAF